MSREFIEKLFEKIISLRARNVELGYGSFVTIGFGGDLLIETIIHGRKETDVRPEWNLWIYMSFWELEKDGELLTCSEDEREIMLAGIKNLEDKKLVNVRMLNETYDMIFEFEEGIILQLFANLEDDYEQWMLFTPEKKVLTAGPFKNYSYEPAGKS